MYKKEKGKAYYITYYVLSFFLITVFTLGCWKLERYINWKFGYKARVEQRIELLEKRVEKLEEKI